MRNINDGGPAFPINPETGMSHKGEIYREAMGMSLRDWFAGQCAAAAMVNARGITDDLADEAFPALARISYKLADAMIAARSGS